MSSFESAKPSKPFGVKVGPKASRLSYLRMRVSCDLRTAWSNPQRWKSMHTQVIVSHMQVRIRNPDIRSSASFYVDPQHT